VLIFTITDNITVYIDECLTIQMGSTHYRHDGSGSYYTEVEYAAAGYSRGFDCNGVEYFADGVGGYYN
jgi:hypothetical protein